MLDWNFENDDGRAPQMHYAHRYVERWQTMRAENLGLLLWGSVGTGKSFLAGCIRKKFIKWQDEHPEFTRIVFHGLRHSSPPTN